jgi:ABC-type Fe3+-hydroxamate transport system substrate-binding protein
MRTILILAALALAACGQATAPVQEASACIAVAQAQWNGLSVEAASVGGDCEQANATLTIKNAAGATLYTEAYPTAQVMTLATARDPAGMETALAEWIGSTNNTMATSGALPDWPANENAPVSGEFPFHPEGGLGRERYMGLRAADVPLFCFVQGMESMACLALENGALSKIGVQLFPG